jgi:hypothetical protein
MSWHVQIKFFLQKEKNPQFYEWTQTKNNKHKDNKSSATKRFMVHSVVCGTWAPSVVSYSIAEQPNHQAKVEHTKRIPPVS